MTHHPTSGSFPHGLPPLRSEAEVRAARQHSLYAPQDNAPVYKLVDAESGEEIVLPARRKCWDGAEIVVRAFEPTRYQESGGKIITDMNEVYVASVVGAKIVKVA